MNKKYFILINELQKTLDDNNVKTNAELTNLLTSYKDQLENGAEYKLICAKLSNAITTYVQNNHFKAPEAVLELYNNIAKFEAQYRGLISLPTWL